MKLVRQKVFRFPDVKRCAVHSGHVRAALRVVLTVALLNDWSDWKAFNSFSRIRWLDFQSLGNSQPSFEVLNYIKDVSLNLRVWKVFEFWCSPRGCNFSSGSVFKIQFYLKSFQHQKSFTLKVLSEQYSVFEIQSVHFGINVMNLISTYYHGNAKENRFADFRRQQTSSFQLWRAWNILNRFTNRLSSEVFKLLTLNALPLNQMHKSVIKFLFWALIHKRLSP